MHRFYVPRLGSPGDLQLFPPDEAQHLARVLRLAVGDEVLVFDGAGRQHRASVEMVTRSEARVRIGEPVDAAPEPGIRITLAQALLKGDKFDDVIRDATMLGASRIQPLLTARVELPAVRAGSVGRMERWERIAVGSAKQCGRAVVPRIGTPQTLAIFLPSHETDRLVMLAEPGLAARGAARVGDRATGPGSVTLLIGPEGGWTDAERDLALGHHATLVTLGPRTLRADAVALVALAVVLHASGDL